MVGSAGWHGCSPAMGEWEDLLLPGRQLLEVQRPVSPPCPAFPHFQTIHGRLRLPSFSPRCSRLALWLLWFKPSPGRRVFLGDRQWYHWSQDLFKLFAREMYPKESGSMKQNRCSGWRIWGATCQWENHLVQSILGDNSEPFWIYMIFLQNEETQEDFGVGDEVLDVVPFDERGKVLEWGSNPKSTQKRIPRNNQWSCLSCQIWIFRSKLNDEMLSLSFGNSSFVK